MKKSILGAAFVLTCVLLAADADTITVKGKTYDEVYVVQTASSYIVAFPKDGSVLSFPKSEVDPANVVVTTDDAKRQTLRNQWSINHNAQSAKSQTEQQSVIETLRQTDLENQAVALEDKVKLLKAVAEKLQESIESLKAEEAQLRNTVSQLKSSFNPPKSVATPETTPSPIVAQPAPIPATPVRPPAPSTPNVAENGDVRGVDNDNDGRAESVYVRGYYRKDGTYVRSHYRARPSR